MTASNQQGYIFMPYIIVTTAATISVSDFHNYNYKRKDRHNRLNILLDEYDDIVDNNCISSRYSILNITGTHSYSINKLN